MASRRTPSAADLSKTENVQRVYDTCRERDWQADVLINNAGFDGQGRDECRHPLGCRPRPSLRQPRRRHVALLRA